ncbi:hypothetical protein ACN9MN_14080 [Chryseobacterium sp. S-02]|uniref:hypothetical protein n=1 Tax=Chryseobacterium sp. S-02 TaxID=3404064 RepID=UPI003CF46993
MKKIIIFLLLSILVTSCKEKQEKVENFSDIQEMFQLKYYKNQEKIKLNDSIVHFIARRADFVLRGDFNTKLNSKTGIWSLKNIKDFQEVQIDYLALSKNDVFENQVIFKAGNKIDSAKSKFFIIENKTKKELVMKFFSPSDRNEISKQAKVIYTIYRNRKDIKTDSIVFGNIREGKYITNIKYDFKKGDDVSGYFSEFVMIKNPKIKDSVLMGNNSIYFIEKFE